VNGLQIYGNTGSAIRRVGSVVTGRYDGINQVMGTLSGPVIRDTETTGAAVGRYQYTNLGVQRIGGLKRRRIAKTASFTVPADGSESGVHYHAQSTTAVTITLPAAATDEVAFSIAGSGAGGSFTLRAESGATINGGASKTLTANEFYEVVCSRNNGGAAAQWVTRA
jgi:hypothetical protein